MKFDIIVCQKVMELDAHDGANDIARIRIRDVLEITSKQREDIHPSLSRTRGTFRRDLLDSPLA